MSLIRLKPVPKHLLLRNLHILLIEADGAIADVMTSMLKSEGATVEVADGAESALQSAQRARPNVILCDLALPDEDATSVVQAIRQLQPSENDLPVDYQAIKAVAIVSCPITIERQRAVASGFQNFLFDPLEYSALMQAIIQLQI